jgi:hypothetical protein
VSVFTRRRFIAGSLALLAAALVQPALAGPPERFSGRSVLDGVESLRATVQRLERQGDKADFRELNVARAHLAEAEGRLGDAAAKWWKVIAYDHERYKGPEAFYKAGRVCSPDVLEQARGRLAVSVCGLAEVERDWATLASELPKVVAYYKARLEMYQDLRSVGALCPGDMNDEKAVGEALKRAEHRLKIVRRTLGPP